MKPAPTMVEDDDDEHTVDFLGILRNDDGEEEDDTRAEVKEERTAEEEEHRDASIEHNTENHHLKSINAAVVIRQLRSRGLSFQIWPAASTLISLLDQNPSHLRLPSPSRQSSLPPIRILELGSGTGLVGIAAAAILGAHVTISDLPHVLPNLQFNADNNVSLLSNRGAAVAVRQLRWGYKDDHEAMIESCGLTPFDLLLASDVVYYEHLIDPLIETLRFFVRGEVAFVMAHLKRWKKRDSVFFKKARKVFDVEILHRDPPLEGYRMGVVVCRFLEKSTCGGDAVKYAT